MNQRETAILYPFFSILKALVKNEHKTWDLHFFNHFCTICRAKVDQDITETNRKNGEMQFLNFTLNSK